MPTGTAAAQLWAVRSASIAADVTWHVRCSWWQPDTAGSLHTAGQAAGSSAHSRRSTAPSRLPAAQQTWPDTAPASFRPQPAVANQADCSTVDDDVPQQAARFAHLTDHALAEIRLLS